jgi:hypothetical protein
VDLVRQLLAQHHHVTEGQQGGPILALQTVEERPTGVLQVREPFAGHTLTHVEGKDDVEGDFVEADEVHLLSNPVVEDLEVTGLQPPHDLTFVRHECVHAHGLELRRERGRLCVGRGRADERKKRQGRGQPCLHRWASTRNMAALSFASCASALRPCCM